MSPVVDWSRSSDAELVEAAVRPATFAVATAEIFERYNAWVVDVCRRELNEWDAVEDAAQDTFAELVRELAQRKGPSDGRALRGYLKTIALRRCMRHMRGGTPGKGHARTMDELGRTADAGELGAPIDRPDDDWRAVDQAIGASRIQHIMDTTVVPSLPTDQQAVYDAAYRRRLTGADLDRALNVAPGEGRKKLNALWRPLATGFLAWSLWQTFRGECPVFDRVVASVEATTGQVFTEELRTGIIRHVLTSTGSDKCATCGPEFARLRIGWEPVLLPFVLVAGLRERFMATIRVALIEILDVAAGGGGSGTRPRKRRRRPAIAGLVLLIIALLIGSAVLITRNGDVEQLLAGSTPVSGSSSGRLVGTFMETPPFVGNPNVPAGAARFTVEIAYTIQPAGGRAGDVLTLNATTTFGYPQVTYLPGGISTCDPNAPPQGTGGNFDFGVGESGSTYPPGKTALILYPLPQGAPADPIFLYGDITPNAPSVRSLSPDGCTETEVITRTNTFVLPADGSIPPGRYQATPTPPQLARITGVGGVPLTPRDVDATLTVQLAEVTVS